MLLMIYTLNIGYCFKIEGIAGRSSDILNSFVGGAVEVDKALELMHLVYLRGMGFEDMDIKFIPEAVAELLFDSREENAVEMARSLIYELYNWS